ncbi:hypothetical protein [Nocardiopsis algeriensis]|uniref:Alanine and proline-rich secreted protein Apa n=1 Tax=Nocardiopsis algeriensis TaxID=1478215 RepID=A0A841II08_9ACTN|nr:hypothetical protein [Nocardiopsis algeriensis]MBB6118399.1 hypothetical protein [Nocardiopsis algeriensis]
MYPDDRDSAGESRGVRTDARGEGTARKVTLAVALVVTFAFLLVTAVGIGWFLSDDGPLSDEGTASDSESPGAAAPEAGGGGGEGTLTDPRAGLSYPLPGDGWVRAGDDEVPSGYTSYVVLGDPEDPDAFIVTGARELNAVEPLPVAGARLAVEAMAGLASDLGSLGLGPSGPLEVDGVPAFQATLESDEADGAYGRFLLLEPEDGAGAFVLGLNPNGGDAATEAIDAAFASVSLL